MALDAKPSARPRAEPAADTIARARAQLRARHYSLRTEEAYLLWIRRFLRHHEGRAASDLGEDDVTTFLTSLAMDWCVAAATQNQALSALLFLFGDVLGRELPRQGGVVRARGPVRLPVVLAREEVGALIARLHGPVELMARLLYGGGLRLLECCRLRVKDVDFGRNEIVVRSGKGDKDRRTMLPVSVKGPLAAHLAAARRRHEADLRAGAGWVELPGALGRKYPNAGREWCWQWVFPATRIYLDSATGQRRRHHLHESVLQRAIRYAVLTSGIAKPATCHSLRHYPACRVIPTRGAA